MVVVPTHLRGAERDDMVEHLTRRLTRHRPHLHASDAELEQRARQLGPHVPRRRRTRLDPVGDQPDQALGLLHHGHPGDPHLLPAAGGADVGARRGDRARTGPPAGAQPHRPVPGPRGPLPAPAARPTCSSRATTSGSTWTLPRTSTPVASPTSTTVTAASRRSTEDPRRPDGTPVPASPPPTAERGYNRAVAFLLAALAALTSAVTSVLQRIGVESAPKSSALRLSLIAHAIRRGIWLVGFALMLVQFGLQATALTLRRAQRRPARPHHRAALPPADPGRLVPLPARGPGVARGPPGGRRDSAASSWPPGPTGARSCPSTREWVVASAILIGAIAACIGAGLRGPRWWRAAAFGAATAVTAAFGAALTKAITGYVDQGWGARLHPLPALHARRDRARHGVPAPERPPRRADHRFADDAGHPEPAAQHRARRHAVRRRSCGAAPCGSPSRCWPSPCWWPAWSSSPARPWWRDPAPTAPPRRDAGRSPGAGHGRAADRGDALTRRRTVPGPTVRSARRSGRQCPGSGVGRSRPGAGRRRASGPVSPVGEQRVHAEQVVAQFGAHGTEQLRRHPGVPQGAVVVGPASAGSGRSSRSGGPCPAGRGRSGPPAGCRG